MIDEFFEDTLAKHRSWLIVPKAVKQETSNKIPEEIHALTTLSSADKNVITEKVLIALAFTANLLRQSYGKDIYASAEVRYQHVVDV